MIGYKFAGRLTDATGLEWTVAVRCVGMVDRSAVPVLLTAHGQEDIDAALRLPGGTVLQDGTVHSVSSALRLDSPHALNERAGRDAAFFEKVRALALNCFDGYCRSFDTAFDELEAARREAHYREMNYSLPGD